MCEETDREKQTDRGKDGRTKSLIHFNREKGLYGDSMWSTTMKHT